MQSKKCIFYPEEKFRTNWELFITLLLLFTCVVTPYRLGFEEFDSEAGFNFKTWDYINLLVDLLFGVDIVLNFFFAYYDQEFILIEDKRVSQNYFNDFRKLQNLTFALGLS